MQQKQLQYHQVAFQQNQPMHGQPPVQCINPQQQMLQQTRFRQLQQQQLAMQQMQRQKLQQQLQQMQKTQHQQTLINNPQAQPTGQPPVVMKPPPQYPFGDRVIPPQQLTGQPRLQYPSQARQISPQQQQIPWQQFAQQQQKLRTQSPIQQSQNVQWTVTTQQQKEEIPPTPQSVQPSQQLAWQQQQTVLQGEQRENILRHSVPQALAWQQQQQRPPSQAMPREDNQQIQQQQQQQQQILQWQKLKQLELQRRQILQQQQQQQQQQQSQTHQQMTCSVQQSSSTQFPAPHSEIVRPSGIPRTPQPTAIPAQYQPPAASHTQHPQPTPPSTPIATAQVTPKTKTALANLLTYRLQGTGRTHEIIDNNQNTIRSSIAGKPIISSSEIGGSPTLQQGPSPISRRTSSEDIILPVTPVPVENERPSVPVPQVHFVGHDPRIPVPPDICLLGCVFCILDYDRHIEGNKIAIWKKVIEQHGGEVEANYNAKCTHVLCENLRNSIVQQAMREGKRCVTAFWLNDVLIQKKMLPPWLALHFPFPFSEEKPCKNQIITISKFEGDERIRLKQMITATGAKYTGYMTQHNTLLICKLINGVKCDKARDWRIPVVNVQWLHDVMFGHYEALRLPMAHKYQQYDVENHFKVDYALVPHLMAAWKTPVKITEEIWKKFLPGGQNAHLLAKKRKIEEKINGPLSKKYRPVLEENVPLTTNHPPSDSAKPHVMFTGVKQMVQLAKIVWQLGGIVTSIPKECTHLVSNRFVRTVKFLCAINVVKYVTTSEWLTESLKQNRFVDEQPYMLHDTEGEKVFGFCLKQTLLRSNRAPIFKGIVLFVTPGVYPSPGILKEIVECGGGTVVLKRRPTFRQIAAMSQAGTKFAVITCDGDLHLCRDYILRKIGVHNAEFILTGVMRQELDFQAFLYS